jgi:disulfide bond formation protein DsbB
MLNFKHDFKRDFWGTLAAWQDRRPVWLLGGSLALGLELFSWAYFQRFLGLQPCEMCVYIRFSMVVIFAGAAWAALKPDCPLFKLPGYGLAFWGLIQGLSWDLTLARLYQAAADDPLTVVCARVKVSFPLGWPLDQWLPGHFAPTADCGADGWSLWGGNMAQWLILVYGLFLAGLLALLAGWLITLFRRRRPGSGGGC